MERPYIVESVGICVCFVLQEVSCQRCILNIRLAGDVFGVVLRGASLLRLALWKAAFLRLVMVCRATAGRGWPFAHDYQRGSDES